MKKLINFPDDLIKKIVKEQCRRGILQFNKTVITILYESVNNKKIRVKNSKSVGKGYPFGG